MKDPRITSHETAIGDGGFEGQSIITALILAIFLYC
jgi:hypothetical protein